MKTRSLVAALGLGLFAGDLSPALARNRAFNEAEAWQLVVRALNPNQRRAPGLGYELNQARAKPHFYRFDVYWDNPNPGSAVVGAFAVNDVTGDVWELVFCEKRDSADLRDLQRALRRRIGVSAQELRSFTNLTPCGPQ